MLLKKLDNLGQLFEIPKLLTGPLLLVVLFKKFILYIMIFVVKLWKRLSFVSENNSGIFLVGGKDLSAL